MRLFLDTSVLLAASGSNRGASREIFRFAPDSKGAAAYRELIQELTNL